MEIPPLPTTSSTVGAMPSALSSKISPQTHPNLTAPAPSNNSGHYRAGLAFRQRFPPPPPPAPCSCPPPAPPQPPAPPSSTGTGTGNADVLQAIKDLSDRFDRDRETDRRRVETHREEDQRRHDRERSEDKKWRDGVDTKLTKIDERLDALECGQRMTEIIRGNACGSLQGYVFEPVCNAHGEYPGLDLRPHLESRASLMATTDAQINEALTFYGLPQVPVDGSFIRGRLYLYHYLGGGADRVYSS
ncbi:hypothetical protein IAT38_002457 [Cryptococcus sp. DSM 104549]